MILIRHCFGRRGYGLKLLVFYGVSFLMGGITMGLFGLMSVPALSANGSMYIEKMTFVHLLSGTVATLLAIRLFLALIREHRYEIQTNRQVIIGYQGNEFCVQGFLDTGNQLREPFSGKPVAVAEERLWQQIEEQGMLCEDRFCVLPYHTVGNSGILMAVRVDRMEINGRTFKNCVLAKGAGAFDIGSKETEEGGLLLSREIIKGIF